MKTVTLYTEEEFLQRWPRYESKTIAATKNHFRFNGFVLSLPDWTINATLESVLSATTTVEQIKQKISDMTAAIAHIEAHPEEE